MNDLPVLNFRDFVMLSGDTLVTDSQKVAKAFGRKHKSVLRAVDHLKDNCPIDWHQRNFAPMVTSVEIGSGAFRQDPAHQITKDGFMLLVMGFTGKQALLVKIAFINAFNAMAEHLKAQAENLWQRRLTAEADYLNAQNHASACARALRYWRDEKPRHLRHIKELEHRIKPSFLLN